jgi:cytochrome b-561
LISFKVLNFGKDINKIIHTVWHCASIICFSIGLFAVFDYINSENEGNLTTIHAFLGLAAIALYGKNFLLGIAHFLIPGAVNEEWKSAYLPTHKFFGLFSLYTAGCAALTGFFLSLSLLLLLLLYYHYDYYYD